MAMKKQLRSRINAYQTQLKFIFILTLTSKIATFKIPIKNLNVLKNLPYADPTIHTTADIDMLIDAELFHSLICVRRSTINNLLFQKALFGWIATGSASGSAVKEIVDVAVCIMMQNQFVILDPTLKRFGKLEDVRSSHIVAYTPKGQRCENFISISIPQDFLMADSAFRFHEK